MNSLPQHCSKYHSNVDQSQGSHVLLSTGRENRTCLFQAHRPLFYSFPLGLHYADGDPLAFLNVCHKRPFMFPWQPIFLRIFTSSSLYAASLSQSAHLIYLQPGRQAVRFTELPRHNNKTTNQPAPDCTISRHIISKLRWMDYIMFCVIVTKLTGRAVQRIRETRNQYLEYSKIRFI